MTIEFAPLIWLLLISGLIQNVTLMVQTYLMKNKSSLMFWLFSNTMSIAGFILLLYLDLQKSSSTVVFISVTLYVLSDVVRLYGIEKELNTDKKYEFDSKNQSRKPMHYVLALFYTSAFILSIYYFNDYKLTSMFIFTFGACSSLFGYSLISNSRDSALQLSKIVLLFVFTALLISNFYIIVQLSRAQFTNSIFGFSMVFIYAYEIVRGLVWSFTTLILNVNQVENEKNDNLVKYETLFNINPDVQFVVRERNLEIIEVNDSFIETTGLKRKEVIGKTVDQIPFFKNEGNFQSRYLKLKNEAKDQSVQIRGTTRSGKDYIGLFSFNRFKIDYESVLINSIKDVSDITLFQKLNLILSDVVRQNPVSIVITQLDGTIWFVNEQFTKMTGYEFNEAIGNTPRILKSGHKDQLFYKNLWDVIIRGHEWQGEIINRRKDGSFYWEKNRIVPIRGEDGEVIAFLSMKDDITNMKLTEESLAKKARIDGLTGIYNYSYFMEIFESYMTTQRHESQKGAMMMIDIDDFKQINDTYGHTFADRVLSRFARSLGEYLRKDDVFGRLGGEEFGILIRDTTEHIAQSIAQRFCDDVAGTMHVTDDGQQARITVSIGVKIFDDKTDMTEVLKQADSALYVSKNSGKNQVTVFPYDIVE